MSSGRRSTSRCLTRCSTPTAILGLKQLELSGGQRVQPTCTEWLSPRTADIPGGPPEQEARGSSPLGRTTPDSQKNPSRKEASAPDLTQLTRLRVDIWLGAPEARGPSSRPCCPLDRPEATSPMPPSRHRLTRSDRSPLTDRSMVAQGTGKRLSFVTEDSGLDRAHGSRLTGGANVTPPPETVGRLSMALTTAPPFARWRGSRRRVCLRSNGWQRPRSWRRDGPAPRRRIAAWCEEARPSNVRWQQSGREAVDQSLGKDPSDRIKRLHGIGANRRGEDTAVHHVDVRYLFAVGRPKAVIQ